MDWDQSQISQAIRHLDFNLSTKWDHAFKLFADAQRVEIQRYLQAGSSNLEHVVRKTLQEYVTGGRIIIQSPYSPEEPSKSPSAGPPKQQLAAESDQHDEVERLSLKLQKTEEELTAAKSQLEEAEIRTDQLRKLIIPVGTEPILDSKIQQLFFEIRTLTQKVVSRLYTKAPRYWESSIDESRVFFKGIQDLPPGLQQDAIHSELFTCLRRWLFSNEIKECGLGEGHENLQSLLGQTEEALFEAVGAKYPGERHREEIQEWRSATFKCTELLQDTSNDPAYYAANLAGCFKPAETDDLKAQQRGRKNLQTLCERSLELGALMRRTEDSFEVFAVKDGTHLVECEDIVEKWRNYSEEGASGVEITVWCLFGGLRKISKEYPTKPVVLEKARVATRFVRRAE
ncbi:uncharacterized protein FFUJ_00182 [Fusarium fujikuroi IMI 58289]|uniref:Uncharacterized protein n=1 Tax=Gibberella fujikuroi (strain CBS 195.34 / IMI 58289 / NRRL A-6831) TaxID=1279085 RepID=S0DLA5_GIBF5|nr:uncharacterized protein FFUJ_00182 [Fusarium fujikuroi IMI 58289]QGI59655.1 hypothetical protein CEK27_001780 [Fusarium fujikuroi]QGI76856.1 hypothetical protein CEK25_001762 [Fusarium fujikuroi]QGI90567.1 hypothetical protein CEK26_001782 [Fusarium fujikuroi]CCT63196.1 uncharacterized protein FFUJ_00182 [Fusarium fujikuroi IMI 58289]SCN71580.1 uncharacterized protein FFM5_00190 [Fusarium fujikuroi]